MKPTLNFIDTTRRVRHAVFYLLEVECLLCLVHQLLNSIYFCLSIKPEIQRLKLFLNYAILSQVIKSFNSQWRRLWHSCLIQVVLSIHFESRFAESALQGLLICGSGPLWLHRRELCPVGLKVVGSLAHWAVGHAAVVLEIFVRTQEALLKSSRPVCIISLLSGV